MLKYEYLAEFCFNAKVDKFRNTYDLNNNFGVF